MSLRMIEPERSGFDLRTFECPKCFATDTLVVSISRDVEVSFAPSLASKTTPSLDRDDGSPLLPSDSDASEAAN
jgi:hypothetical protein